MFPVFLKKYSSSLQRKLFFSLTAVVATSLFLTLSAQVFLIQDYFVRQAETSLRNSNYLLSRALADPLFERNLELLQARLKTVHARNPLCGMQLKDDQGNILFKRGISSVRLDSGINPNNLDGCYDTVLPVVRGEEMLGTLRFGISTEEIAQARNDLIQESVMIAALLFALFLLPFFIQIRRMMQPLDRLSEAVLQFSKGNFDLTLQPLPEGTDEVGRLSGNFREMAQNLGKHRDWQAATMAALKNEKTVLNTLMASLPVGVVLADHTHIRYGNAAFRQMFQFVEEDVVGMQNEEMVRRIGLAVADASQFLEAITELLESQSSPAPEYINLKNGRVLRLTSSVVISPESRDYLGRFWLFEDVTQEIVTH
ncbi:MAG: hypothetical protein Fur0040_08760 [Sideroxydans sp.]